MKTTMTEYRSAIGLTLVAACILLAPLLAMQITDDVVWGLADFAVVGALLFGAVLMYELAARKVRTIEHRAAVGLALVAVLILVWAELAVGVFGTAVAGS